MKNSERIALLSEVANRRPATRTLMRSLTLSLGLLGAIACSSKISDGKQSFEDQSGGQSSSGGTTSSGGVSSNSAGQQQMPGSGGSGISLPPPGSSGGSDGSMAGGGAGGKMVTEQCASSQTSSTDTTMVQPADIIFAIDTSSSMTEEIVFTQTYMNEFSQLIVDSGIDVRVIMIAGPRTGGVVFPPPGSGGAGGRAGATGGAGGRPAGMGGATGMAGAPGGVQGQSVCIGSPLGSGTCPNDTNLPRYVHIEHYVDSHDALNVIVDMYPMYKQYLRPNASKSFVVISDDNATMMSAAFSQAVTALDATMFKTWTFNGVFCFTKCGNAAAAVGTVFQDLVTQTKGVSGDLCEQDFQPVFKRLAQQIVQNSGSKIACEWNFPPPPAGKSFSTELVQVQRSGGSSNAKLTRVKSSNDCVAGGWYYDDPLNPKKILACPQTCDQLQNDSGGKIDITFGCEEVGGCAAASATAGVGAGALSCDWELPSPPQGTTLDLASVNVRFTNEAGFATTLGKVSGADACAMFDLGWYYDNPANPKRILACPDTCTKLQQGGAMSKIDVLFGCSTIIAPPR